MSAESRLHELHERWGVRTGPRHDNAVTMPAYRRRTPPLMQFTLLWPRTDAFETCIVLELERCGQKHDRMREARLALGVRRCVLDL